MNQDPLNSLSNASIVPPVESGIADIKPLHDVPFETQDLVVVALAAALVLIALGILIVVLRWFARRRKGEISAPVALEPQEHWSVAVKRRLDALPENPAEFEELRFATFELGSVLREVLGRVLHHPASELTAAEIRQKILPLMAPDQARAVDQFFSDAELILFAKVNLGSAPYESGRRMAIGLLTQALEQERESETHHPSVPPSLSEANPP